MNLTILLLFTASLIGIYKKLVKVYIKRCVKSVVCAIQTDHTVELSGRESLANILERTCWQTLPSHGVAKRFDRRFHLTRCFLAIVEFNVMSCVFHFLYSLELYYDFFLTLKLGFLSLNYRSNFFLNHRTNKSHITDNYIS